MVLVVLARRHDRVIEAILSGIPNGSAALFVYYGHARLDAMILMNQWINFLAMPTLARLCQSRKRPAFTPDLADPPRNRFPRFATDRQFRE
ncbi:hypothetical protein [Tabrizicola sp.]|uniref:hypothetical protein n=1 Tax=Tabrizicola sp. TaxID=2005166 RepID=UPI00286C9994|nr:hypothetical protein [Tabrizicola sp.]